MTFENLTRWLASPRALSRGSMIVLDFTIVGMSPTTPAAATVLALEHDGPAVLHIVDDEPSPTREWLPELARIVGAKRPNASPACSPGSSRARRRS